MGMEEVVAVFVQGFTLVVVVDVEVVTLPVPATGVGVLCVCEQAARPPARASAKGSGATERSKGVRAGSCGAPSWPSNRAPSR
jgi:hypothetical protein